MKQCNYKAVRKLYADDLRELCIAKHWYTNGTNEEYENLLYTLAQEKKDITTADIVEIAKDIKAHSNTEHEIYSICFEVARICYSYFEEIHF